MAWVAAAIVGSGALSAGASIYGANTAADAQTEALGNSMALKKRMWEQAVGELQPFINMGKEGISGLKGWLDTDDPKSPLAMLLKLTSPGADMSAALEDTPGFKFSREQGQKAVTSGLAARGLAGPGGALAKGGANFAEGLAGTTWQQVVAALQNTFSSGANAKQNVVNTGTNAAGALAGTSTAAGNSIGNDLIGTGNAQAAGAIGTANAVGGFGNSVSSAVLLNRLLGNNGGGGPAPGTGTLYDLGQRALTGGVG